MGKKSFYLLIIILSIVTLAVTGCGKREAVNTQPGNQKVIELKLHHHDPPNSIIGRFLSAWATEIQEKTNGRVKVTIFAGASLGNPKDAYNMVSNGICDIAMGFVGLHPGQFPMTEVIGLPMLGIKDTRAGSLALWDLYQNTDYLKKEYKNVHVLFMYVGTPAPIGTKNKIESAEDLKSLKLRSPGGPPMEFLKLLGATPIGMPPADIYESMGKGVIDGWTIDWMGVENFKLAEVTKNILDAKAYVGPFWVTMNKAKWDSLPEDVQKIITEVSGKQAAEKIGREIDQVEKIVDKQIAAKDGVKYTLSDAENKRWQEAAKIVWGKWVTDMTAKGYPAQDALTKTQEIIKKCNENP